MCSSPAPCPTNIRLVGSSAFGAGVPEVNGSDDADETAGAPLSAATDISGPAEPPAPGGLGGTQIGRLFGVPIYVQPGWLLLAAVLITYSFEPTVPRSVTGAQRYLLAFGFAILLYASVLVHELGHSVLATRFGMRVRRINLQLLGGVSEIEQESASPGQEFAIAFAGPALSFGVAVAAWLATLVFQPTGILRWLLYTLMVANILVGLFNLLPGLPLDGGRVLHAVIWKVTGSRHTGLVVGAWIGRALAVALIVFAALPLLRGARGGVQAIFIILVAAFLWAGAGQTLRLARWRRAVPSLQSRTLYRKAVSVPGDMSVTEALRRSILARAPGLIVVDDKGTATGLVSDVAVRAVPDDRRDTTRIGDLARHLTQAVILPAGIGGEDLLRALQNSPATEYLLVEADGSILGVLFSPDVDRAMAGW